MPAGAAAPDRRGRREGGIIIAVGILGILINRRNSAHDLKCRTCGEEPGCEYVAKHSRAVTQYLRST
jgi:hypothetical protein